MRISAHYTLEVRDERGKLVRRIRRVSHSYVRATADWLHATFGFSASTLVPDTGNVNRTMSTGSGTNGSGANDADTNGLVVGTGTNAVALSDYALQTQITHGLGAGQLDYQATETAALQTVGSTRSFEIRRVFVNQSGATITINECGQYVAYGALVFCFIRDVVSPGVAVPNNGSATLIYTLGVTV